MKSSTMCSHSSVKLRCNSHLLIHLSDCLLICLLFIHFIFFTCHVVSIHEACSNMSRNKCRSWAGILQRCNIYFLWHIQHTIQNLSLILCRRIFLVKYLYHYHCSIHSKILVTTRPFYRNFLFFFLPHKCDLMSSADVFSAKQYCIILGAGTKFEQYNFELVWINLSSYCNF
jgi:hypothetical protein